LEGAEEQSFRKLTATLTDRFALLVSTMVSQVPHHSTQHYGRPLAIFFTYLVRIRMTTIFHMVTHISKWGVYNQVHL